MSTVNNGPQIVRSGLVLDLDASYMRSYSPNVYPNPTDLLATQYMGNEIQSCTVSRDTTITRQYGSIPMKMVITGNDAYAGRYGYLAANLASALSGQTWTISVWAKASVATDGQLFIFGADTNGAWSVTPDYSAGTIAITTSWQRFSFSYTFTNANTRYIQFRLDGTNTGGSGITIWWDGLQVERASSATTFNPYYFGNTVWKDVVGSNNCSLITGPIFDSINKGTIYFDGGTSYCAITPSNSFAWTPSSIGLNNMSIDIWIKTSDSAGGQMILSKPWNSSGEYNYTLYHNGFTIVTGNQTNTLGFSSIATGNWTNLIILVSTTQFGAYVNGVQVYALTNHGITNNTPTVANAQLQLTLMTLFPYGEGGNSGFSVQGNVASLRMYNRVLSAVEIMQNYQATKTRFGL
jgi:hypothetical protein